jgi:hypothetical protein
LNGEPVADDFEFHPANLTAIDLEREMRAFFPSRFHDAPVIQV